MVLFKSASDESVAKESSNSKRRLGRIRAFEGKAKVEVQSVMVIHEEK